MRQSHSRPPGVNPEAVDDPDAQAPQTEGAPRKRARRPKLKTHTIHDIAALADVSSITVSRYFNAPEKVSAGVRERLRQIIGETGYVPSKMAGQLASARSRIVGAIMQNTGSITFADLVKGMGDGFGDSGLQLLLAHAEYSQQLEAKALRALAGWHPSALILTRDDHTPESEALLHAARGVIVETWGVVSGRPFHQVGFPHAQVGVDLARHFLAQGARRVRFALRAAPHDFRAQQRAQGYAATMREAGLQPDIDHATASDEFEAGAEALARFAGESREQRPEAIIFASDHMAVGAILQAPALGLSLPRDCAMAGFGDAPIAARLHPALTTIQPQPYAIGMAAARLVLTLLEDPAASASPQVHLVPCRLLVRGSCHLATR